MNASRRSWRLVAGVVMMLLALVWLAGPYARGLNGGGILLRVDPDSGRVVGWLRDPRWSFQDVLADGLRGAWVATTAPDLLYVVVA